MEKDKEELKFEGTTLELFYSKIGINFVSYLPSGKTVLVDKKEKDMLELEEGIPYLSFIKKEISNTAFATIISEAFIPRIIVLTDKILLVTKNGDEIEHNDFQKIEEVFDILKKKNIERCFILIRY